MSGRLQVRDAISEFIGMNPLTMELHLRYLARADRVQRNAPGHRSGDYTAEDIKNVLLSMAAYQPSAAVEAVEALDSVELTPTNALNGYGPSGIAVGTRFGVWIVSEIQRLADPEARDCEAAQRASWAANGRSDPTITMSVSPARVRYSSPAGSEGRIRTLAFFASPETLLPPLRQVFYRETTFDPALLSLAGKLLGNVTAKQGKTPLPSAGGKNRSTPTNKKADLLPGKSALSATSTNHGNRKKAGTHTGIGSLNSSDDTACVCPSSSGSRLHERTRKHEPCEPHHGAGL